jgi:hypothetical protein
MKPVTFFFTILLFVLGLMGCASQKDAKYRQDPRPKFSDSRDFEQKPELIKPIAESLLKKKIAASDPSLAVNTESDLAALKTDWIYGVSKDKYLVFDFNGSPKRKPIPVRRKYIITLAPSVAGTLASVNITEEIADLDKKTGQEKGWKSVPADRALYQDFFSELELAIRQH